MAILTNLTISVSGDVGHRPEQLRRWVEANGGQWVPRVARGITHLLCSEEHWKKENDAVTMALRFGAQVVSYHWLEDSLQRKRKLSVRRYLWSSMQKQSKKMKKLKKTGKSFDTQAFKKGSVKALEETGSGTSLTPLSSAPSSFQSALEELKDKRAMRAAEAKSKREASDRFTVDAAPQTDDEGDDNKTKSAEDYEASGSDENGISKARPAPQSPTRYAQPSTIKPSISSNPVAKASTLAKASTALAKPSAAVAKPFTAPAPPPNVETHRLKDNFHTYVDPTGFAYDVIVVRPNKFRATQANYTIRLFESNTKPHTYTTVVRYRPAPGISWPSENDLIHTPGIPGVIYPPPSPPSLAPPSITTTTPNPPFPNPHLAAAQALLTPTPHTSNLPYRTLLCPTTSPFPTAFTLFRRSFRTLTLLHWHERLHASPRSLQIPRAIALDLEPYLYQAPGAGLPFGLLPEAGAAVDEERDPYLRAGEPGALDLPGMRVRLNREGVVGGEMVREAEMRRRGEEEERGRGERERSERRREGGGAGRAPLFNGVRGRPVGR